MGLVRRGQVWWMNFTYQGRQIRRSTETSERKIAQRILDKVKGEVAEGKWFERVPGEDRTFKEMMEKYMVEHSSINKAPKSHIRDKSLRDHLVSFFGDFYLSDISPRLISRYKVTRREEGCAPKTVNNELTLMAHAFNLALKEWEWVKENPVQKVSREKVNNQIERWLTLEEEEKLLANSPQWLGQIISFAINSGLRQGEILDLRWPLVDLSRRTIMILEQKNKGKDTLPVNETAARILAEKARGRDRRTDYVFCNGLVGRIDSRNLLRAFYSAIERAGILKLRFHDLRHTFATRLVQAGVDIYTVQKLGRWKSISMVMRYAHHYPESLRSGVEVLDKLKNFSTILAQSHKKGVAQNA